MTGRAAMTDDVSKTTADAFAVSVLIPCRTVDGLTRACVDACRNALPAADLVVLPDTAPESPQALAARVVPTGACTIAAKRNRGAEATAADYLALIDSDARPDGAWPRAALALLKADPSLGAVGGPNLPPPEETGWRRAVGNASASILIAGTATYRKRLAPARDCPHLPSCNLVVRRADYLAVGGMDETLITGEDIDFCRRLLERGQRIRYSPDVRVFHRDRDLRGFFVQRMCWGAAVFEMPWRTLACQQYFLPAFPFVLLLLTLAAGGGLLHSLTRPLGGGVLLAVALGCGIEAVRHAGSLRHLPATWIALLTGLYAPGVGTAAQLVGRMPDRHALYRNNPEEETTPPTADTGGDGMSGHTRTAWHLWANRSAPVSLVHFVTDRCNARCPHCFIDFDHPAANALTLDEIRRLAPTLGPALRNVNLTGGEPFLHPHLAEIGDIYFSATAIESLFVSTNGSLPDRAEGWARQMQACAPSRRVVVSISLDHHPAEHDRHRGVPGLFEKARATYRALDALRPFVLPNIGITVSHWNYDAVLDLYQSLIEDYGVKAITVTLARPAGVYQPDSDTYRRVVDAYGVLVARVLADLERGTLEGFDRRTLQGRMMNAKNRIAYHAVLQTAREDVFIAPCRAAALFGVIGTDGTVYPCEILDRPLGSLRDYDMNFLALWKSGKAKETRRWIAQTRCHCTYECAWTLNILGNLRYLPALAWGTLHR